MRLIKGRVFRSGLILRKNDGGITVRAIIVDDEKNVRYIINDFITSFDLEIEIIAQAENGEVALKCCKKMKPDLVISDIKMPNLNGIEMLEEMRIIDENIMCIFVSAYTDFNFAQAAIKQGAKGYILKPIQAEELYQLLKEVREVWIKKQKEKSKFKRLERTVNQLKSERLNDVISEKKINNDYNRVIYKVINYIEEYYHEDISLDSVADNVFLNKNYLSDLFHKEIGKSFVQYLTEFRLEKAKTLYEIDDFRVGEIADMVGFSDCSYFIKLFKKYTGATPNEYRRHIITRGK